VDDKGEGKDKELIDAENVIIPFLRAKFDGDPTHDKITWVIQQEHYSQTNVSGIPEVFTGTYMIALFEVTGIMFNVKDRIPELFLKDQATLTQWADKAHRRFISSLIDQMRQLINDVSVARDDLVDLHWKHWGVDIS